MTETTPDWVVDSDTGVEVSVPVAGPGARAYAFLVDWHIRAVLAAAWYIVAALIYNGRWTLSGPLNPNGPWFAFVIAPPAAIYFLYHLVLEIAMHGRTPGKRMAQVRLVTRDGETPSIGALLARNVFRLVDSLPAFYGVGLITTFVTHDHVRVGDLAAGTLLAYDRPDSPLLEQVNVAIPGRTLDPITAEILNELLQRWSSLDRHARWRLARHALERCGQEVPAADDDATLRAQLERLVRGIPGANR
jgi:uncharacterized RDD family membrane protein YckC